MQLEKQAAVIRLRWCKKRRNKQQTLRNAHRSKHRDSRGQRVKRRRSSRPRCSTQRATETRNGSARLATYAVEQLQALCTGSRQSKPVAQLPTQRLPRGSRLPLRGGQRRST